MYTAIEIARILNVSKVTIYKKLKKFEDKVIVKDNQKFINDELLKLIKEDLKVKDIEENEVATDTTIEENIESNVLEENLYNLDERLLNTILEQLSIKDKQLEEKDKQIQELHRLIENNQVLLKQEKQANQLQLEEHLKELDFKLEDIREKNKQKKKEHEESKKGFFRKIFKS